MLDNFHNKLDEIERKAGALNADPNLSFADKYDRLFDMLKMTLALADDVHKFQEFEKRVRKELVPKIESSKIFASICNGTVDVKFAVELGLAIMHNKPIIACVTPGTIIPDKLAQIADAIVEFDPNNMKESSDRLMEEIERMTKKL